MHIDISTHIEHIYKTESRRIYATLVRLLGDMELAEEALQEAFFIAMTQWRESGVPANPRAWLVSTGRFRAIDRLRRQARFQVPLDAVADHLASDTPDLSDCADDDIEDDRLRLIFTCCHPALAMESRVALTLREVCGLATEEIASAFLTTTPTLAQRIVRAKTKIRDARIPFEIPPAAQLPERLDSVLQVIYLLYNEGYSSTSGDRVTRADLAAEAIRLGELLLALIPEPETMGLLALMLLQESRRDARIDTAGELVLLPDQDRSRWDHDKIARGTALVERALTGGRFGPYGLQAAIAAVHAEAPVAEATDWPQIVGLYDLLLSMTPTPVVALNRAVAISMRDGPDAALAIVDALLTDRQLAQYHLAHAVRADLYRQTGRIGEARAAYERALELTQQEPERRFLAKRLAELAD
jgi:RNA polymerase sigma-70 factor (ECF subfamily)